MKRHSLYIFALSALTLAGCQKNGLKTVYTEGDSIVRFAPSVAATETSTKGALINEDGTAGAFDTSKSFFVTAYDGTTSANVIPGTAGSYQEVKMKGTQWNTVYTEEEKEYVKEYLWKSGETKTFYAYANLPSATGAASISCTSSASQTLTYTVPSTASAQTDILMGFYSGNGTTGTPASMTGTASIVFSHPLTAVQFKLGTIEGVTSLEINSISIEGVYASGTAEMTPTTAAATNSEARFTWTPTGTTTVSQTISTQPTAAGDPIGEAFLLIPQEFSSSSTARIAVQLTIDGVKPQTLYYPLNTSWLAGFTTTCTIKYERDGSFIIVDSSEAPEQYEGSPLDTDSGSESGSESESATGIVQNPYQEGETI